MASPNAAGPGAPAQGSRPVLALDRYLDHVDEAIVTFDINWRFTFLNSAATRLFNKPKSELLGQVIWQVLPEYAGTDFQDELGRVFAEGQHRCFDRFDAQSGSSLEIRAYPSADGVVALIRDVTDARQKEANNRHREERFRLALSFGRMGVWELDIDTLRVHWSAELEAIHGLSPGSFDGNYRSAAQMVHPDDLPSLKEAFRGAIEHGDALAHEFRIIRPDGSIQNLYSHGKVVKDEKGRPMTLLGVTMDVTDQKRAAQELQKRFDQLQLLFDLASTVSRSQDPGEVYSAALEGLASAVGADRASVAIFDEDGVLRYKAWSGLSEEYRASAEAQTPWPRGALDAQPIAVPDVRQEGFLAPYRDVFAKEGICAVVFVPLLGKSTLIGKFMLYYNRPRNFHPEELRVAQTIATHFVQAIERQHSEIALRASEQNFRSIFSQAAVGIAKVGIDGKFLLLNSRFCEMLGYSEPEILQLTLVDVTHPEDRESSASLVRGLLAGEAFSRGIEKRYIRKDGATVWARVHASLVRDHAGTPQYFTSVVEDISGRVEAERALHKSELSFAFAQSAAGLGAWDWDVRSDRLAVSRECARLHGLPPAHVALTYEEWLGAIHTDDRARVDAEVRAGLARTHSWDIHYRVVWPDGSAHWLLGKGLVFRDDSGRAVRMAGISLDVTERKQTEVALLESEERFRNMADTAPVMIWVAGTDKVLTFFNRTWLDFVGRALEQELNNGWVESVHPDDRGRCYQAYAAAFDARQNFHIEYRLRRADGEYRRVICSGVPRFAPGGEFAGYIGSDIDITDLRHAQEQEFERQKVKSLGVLSAGIAHDFNNLLGSILADAEIAEADVGAGTLPVAEILRIKTVAVRAAEIVRQLMIYSGQDQADLGPVNLSSLVADMLELLKVSISKNAELQTDLPLDLAPVRGNAPQLRQVVMNLVINASEAIGNRHGVIAVSTSLNVGLGETSLGDCIRLVVSDTGCGMTEEQQSRIFEPFFTTKFSGRGLGMSVVQGIVRAHGGTIQVASAPEQGTTFEILLPCAEHPAQGQTTEQPATDAEQVSSAVTTVLIVEDEEMLRGSVSKMLRKRGHRVLEAGNGTSAVEILRDQQTVDVLFLDMTIPGAPSPEVVLAARQNHPEIKIILTSAYSREMVMSTLAGHEISAFLRKPFVLADLVACLRKTLGS